MTVVYFGRRKYWKIRACGPARSSRKRWRKSQHPPPSPHPPVQFFSLVQVMLLNYTRRRYAAFEAYQVLMGINKRAVVPSDIQLGRGTLRSALQRGPVSAKTTKSTPSAIKGRSTFWCQGDQPRQGSMCQLKQGEGSIQIVKWEISRIYIQYDCLFSRQQPNGKIQCSFSEVI